MALMTGGQALIRQLHREGVRVIFGLPGDQTMHALDALYDEPDIRFITTRHEQGTTYMADGYARTSGQPGSAFVVPGVGVYNAGAGLATAYACSSPVLLIAGQVNRGAIGRNMSGLHDIHDQLEIVRPVTKWAERILEPTGIPSGVREAFRQMATGRPRPVEIEIPPEAMAEKTDMELIDPVEVPVAEIDHDAVASAAAELLGASRPLIVAGGGANLGDASDQVTALAEFLQAPVVATREGKGIIDDRNPLSVGTMWNNPRLRRVIDSADVILAIGTRFQAMGTSAAQKIIHIDIDPEEIGKHATVSLPIVGDARATSQALLDTLRATGSPRPSRAAEIEAIREVVADELRAIGPQAHMVEQLRRGIPDNAILAVGTTTIGYMCHMHFPVYEPRSYLSTSYMGCLGAAFPIALGAKVAAPDRPVVAIKGDGGFLFAATELATAVQFGINAVTVVFNDGAYGNSNRDQRDRFGGREIGTELRNPDFAAFARSFGADGVRVPHIDQLADVVREAIGNNRPTVVEVPMDRLPSPF
jgi:acetolactate synthase-1/2/3 large subunit